MTPMTGLEIITIPFYVWQAAVGKTFPAIDAVPSADWTLMGLNGLQNMGEKGVIIKHSAKYETDPFRTLGDTGAWDVIRSSEDLTIEFELMDLTLETYAQALQVGPYESTDIVKETVATQEVPGMKQMGLYRGVQVSEVALLVRGPSPYLVNTYLQFEIPRCVQVADPIPTVSKKNAATLLFIYKSLMAGLSGVAGAPQRFGRLIAQTTAKSA